MDLYDIYDQIPEGNDGRDPVREVRLETDKTELFAFSRVSPLEMSVLGFFAFHTIGFCLESKLPSLY